LPPDNACFLFGIKQRPAFLAVNGVVQIRFSTFYTEHKVPDRLFVNDTGINLPRKKRPKAPAACVFHHRCRDWTVDLLIDKNHFAISRAER